MLPILTDEEVRPLIPVDDECGLGALATPLGNLPLAAVNVKGRISGLLAEVTLEQTFKNTHAQPLEATYIFPLPDRAGVTGFRFEVAGRVIDGVLKERGQAREEYEQALQKGHRAAIAEEERPGTFTMRVGNLLPRESAKVRLTMTMPLPFADGEATFRFPLVIAPRYIPGAPLGGEDVGSGTASDTDAVPDASRITPPVLLPGFPNPVRLAIELELDESALKTESVRCALHAAVETREGGKRVVRLHPGDRLNRDFILRLGYGVEAVRTGLSLSPDNEGGTFALTLVPPTSVSKSVRPREVIFVLDHSGSMSGWKMVAARRAVARMVDTLTDRDRFNVIAFDDGMVSPPAFNGQELVPATDRNRFRAVEFLAKVEADGGTEMAQPLQRAVGVLGRGSPEHDRVLVLATDGQVGNEDQILRSLGKQLAGIRVFTVGIDRAVNEGFLQRMAAAGGGAYELVESEQRLDEAMDRLHRRVGTPVLTELKIEGAGLKLDASTIAPSRLPDLFAGAPVVISGRFTGAAKGGVRLTARDAAGQSYSTELAVPPAPNAAVTTVWARGRVRDLEDRYVIEGSPGNLADEILKTSLRFGVLCRFTAFVAVDRAEVVNKGGPIKRQTQAVDAPEGWDMLKETAAGAPVFAAEPAMDALSEFEGAAPAEDADNLAKAELSRSVADAKARPATGSAAVYNAPARGRANGGAPGAPPPAPAKPAAAQSVAMPSPAAAPKRSASVAGPASLAKKVKAIFGGGAKRDEAEAQEQGESAPALPLDAYRARARELLELLQGSADETARRVRLGTLLVRLGMLLEDLRSIGADRGLLASLTALHEELQKAVLAPVPPPYEATAEQVLRAFAEGGGSTTPRGGDARQSFWK
ncbi:MAG: VWA domain-containing protein [Deltaproteobacteria bacterium]|nr:VWA domain-containing protein [Deltaproteobacteria bacterium]